MGTLAELYALAGAADAQLAVLTASGMDGATAAAWIRTYHAHALEVGADADADTWVRDASDAAARFYLATA